MLLLWKISSTSSLFLKAWNELSNGSLKTNCCTLTRYIIIYKIIVPQCWKHTLLILQQSLTDLENSRDDLLFELHKLPNQAPADTIMLKEYFEDVNELSKFMGKQIKLGLERTLNTVRKEPTLIVTILRIIEREEKADAEADEVC
jgi:hypothetical protein